MVAAEKSLNDFLCAEYGAVVAMRVPRASLGLLATLRAWVARGHEPKVALCANVCHDVVASVLGASCRPLFLDLDPATGQVTSTEWARARAAGASVALVVHLYGNPVDVASVREHFDADSCLLIDDAAQALGAVSGECRAGSQGDVGLLSFGPTKHIEAGGGVVLFKSIEFAASVQSQLSAILQSPDYESVEVLAQFRRGLDIARARLCIEGDAAVVAFNGLLNAYPSALWAVLPNDNNDILWREMQGYDRASRERCEKADAWAAGLAGTSLRPVGMGKGAVPWRYTCRLPSADWATQHRLAEAMRARGLHVSHWYLPAHWMLGAAVGSLPGVEQLAREVFQFWVDPKTSMKSILEGAAEVVSLLQE